MGDRRKGDRRAPEEGVIRIQKKNVGIYGALILILVLAIALNIVSWYAYFKSRNKYNSMVEHFYNSDNNNVETPTITTTNSNYSCDLSINASKESIKPGESIEYELTVSNMNAGNGIKAFETYINYDSNLFDCTVKSNEESNWSKAGFLEGYLTMIKNENVNAEDQVIAKIVFTAKANVTKNSYKVNFEKIKFTSEDDQVFGAGDSEINIQVD